MATSSAAWTVVLALMLLVVFQPPLTMPKKTEPPPSGSTTAPSRFEDRWFDRTQVPVLKANQEPIPVVVKTVVTERISMSDSAAPVSVPPVAVAPEPDKPRVQRRRHVSSNVCTRQGLRKVFYGRKWRCRR